MIFFRLLFRTGFFRLLPAFTAGVMVLSCARQGRPEGGDKDTTPPRVTAESPPSGTVNFKGDKIVIRFDEFILLDNPLQKIVFSPPLATAPKIKPSGYPSKKVEIKFTSPLAPETTYTIHFNDAIKDFHEGNVLENYTYVFSTGPRLDSLTLTGTVRPSLAYTLPDEVLIGLYPADSTADSLLHGGKPLYLTRAAPDGKFTFTHLPQGRFRLFAFSDDNRSLNYQPGQEAVGFLPRDLELPGDSAVQVVLFYERTPLQVEDLRQVSVHHWQGQVGGSRDSTAVYVEGRRTMHYFSGKNLHVWVNPVAGGDSLRLIIMQGRDTVWQGLRRASKKARKDTLLVRFASTDLYPLDTLWIQPTVPLDSADTSLIRLNPSVPYRPVRSADGRIGLVIPYDESRLKYRLTLLPGALIAFTGHVSADTLRHSFEYYPSRKTGSFTLKWEKPTATPVIVLLTDTKGENIFREIYLPPGTTRLRLDYLPPGKYRLMLVADRNANGRYDTGDLKEGRQPEPVYHYPKVLDIRPNWQIEEKTDLRLD
ncbi:MAG: Ig-like domain-containing protein [Chlorobi bacterium]|nr:Ig-like domain-containing protein [Chlorobiota bacterium]